MPPPIRICCRRGSSAPGSMGTRTKGTPGKRLDINMYTDGHLVKNAKRLPLNMLDALRALGKSATIKGSMGEFVPSYLKLKHEEWNSYCRHLTQWERDA